MNVVGLNAFHGDSSACIFVDGVLQAAAEEERFRRIKHWAGFPGQALAFCLQAANLKLSDVDVIAINTDPKAARFKKLAYAASGHASMRLLKEKLLVRKKRMSLQQHLELAFPGQAYSGRFEYVEHHLAHLASAFLISPFAKASVVSVDGFGDFASAAWGIGHGSKLVLERRIHFPHSLGIFYQALTQFLGFPHYGDEYKVMGLAPYGEVRYAAEMDELLRLKADGGFALNLKYFKHHREPIGYEWEDNAPQVSSLFSARLEQLLGPARTADQPLLQKHKDIARSIQDAYERAFFHMLNTLHREHQTDCLTIAGGCGMNSVANGKIHLHTPYKQIYVQSAAGDAGGALGAALIANARHSSTGEPVPRPFTMRHSYWGPSFDDEELVALLNQHAAALNTANCQVTTYLDEEELLARVADELTKGHVIGWFQGAMEWGPRALGNRSILGDPRRADMKDILNLKIKRRESFRPFAPSVLREHVSEWFESDADVPFMMKVFQIKAAQRSRIPAVTHVDGSGRLQTVDAAQNPRYHGLIRCFYEKTGVPMLLNTSFNENEPVVCKPQEALDCFLRTRMDVLVLGSHLVIRNPDLKA